MTGSDGVFTVKIGGGVRTGNDAGLALTDVFSNRPTAINGLNCPGGGSSYTPGGSDSRNVYVTFVDGTDVVAFSAPYVIQSVPYALEAERLAGKTSTDFLQTNLNSTQSKLDGIMGPTNYTELLALLSGTSTQYLSSSSTNGTSLPVLAAPPASPTAGRMWYEGGSLKYYDGGSSSVKTVSTSDSAIQSGAAAGGDLSGTFPNPTVAKVSGKAVVLTSPVAGEVLQYDGTKFVNASTADAMKLPLAGGTMTGAIDMGSQNLTNLGFVTMSANKSLHLSNNASDPAGLVAADKGKVWFNSTSNQMKYWDGSAAQTLGVSGSGLQTFNTQTGSTQTLAIGTSGTAPGWNSASNVHTLNIPMASTASVTAGLLSKTDYDAFTAKLDSSATFVGDVSGTYGATSVDKIKGKAVTPAAYAAGQTLRYDGTQWVNAVLGFADLGSTPTTLAGYGITDAQSSTLANGKILVGNASNVATAVTMSGDATLSNAGALTLATVPISKGGTGVTSFTGDKVITTSAAGALQASSCGLGQVISFTAGGAITCVTPAAGSVTSVTSANSYLSVATGTSTPVLTVNVGTAANTVAAGDDARFTDSRAPNGTAGGDLSGTYPNPSVAKVSGKAVTLTSPTAGDVLTYDGTGFVNAPPAADATKLPLAGGTMSGAIDMGSQNLTSTGFITMSANKNLHLSNNASDPAGLVAADKGKMWFNSTSGEIKFWNGSSAQPLGVAGSGLQTFNTQTGTSQTLAIGTSGTAPGWNSASNVHTLNIPMASTASVTAGLLSKTDYDAFTAKLDSSATFAGDVSGTYGATSVDKIKGKTVSPAAYAAGQTLRYDGTNWVNSVLAFADLGSKPTTLAGYGITDAQSSTLSDGKILVGNGSNVATAVTMSGDATLSNAGALTLATVPISKGGTGVTSFAGDKVITTSAAGALQASSCGLGQVISFTAGGAINCVTPTSGTVTSVTSANSYLSVATGTSTPVLTVNVGTAANTVAAGDDARFTDSRAPNGSAGGDLSGTYPNPAVAKISGKAVTPTTYAAGQTLRYDGTQWVNSVLAFADLGSTPTTLAGYGITDAQSSTLADGKIFVGNGSNVATAVTMSGDATLSNAGALTLATVPIAKGGTGQTTKTAAFDALAPNTTKGDVTVFNGTNNIRLPAGTDTYVLTADSSQASGLKWAAPSSSGITSLGGLTASTQTFAIGTSGTAPAFSSATSTHTLNIPMASTASVTAGLISKTDYDAFNTKLGTSTAFSGDVSGAYNATSVDKIKGKTVSPAAYSAGQTLRYDGTNWVNSVLAFADLGSKPTTLAGYGITDAQSSSLTDGKILVGNSSNVATAVTMSGDATLADTGAITLATVPVAKGGTAATSFAANAVIVSNGTGSALQALNCTSGEVITFDASGYAGCGSASATGWAQGGNSFGIAATLGTNDAYSLGFKTNNTTQMTILSTGKVGIATTTPGYNLTVNGTTYSTSIISEQGGLRVNSGSAGYGALNLFSPVGGAGKIAFASGAAGWAWDTYLVRTNANELTLSSDASTGAASLIVRGSASLAATSGSVGIGTTSPTARLDIAGSISSAASVSGKYLNVQTGTATDSTTAASGTAAANHFNTFTASTLAATNTSVVTTDSATVRITGAPIKGTNNTVTNAVALDVGSTAVGAQTNSYGLRVAAQTGATNNYAGVFTGGYVGIGTSTPAQALEVSGGNIKVSGSVTTGSTEMVLEQTGDTLGTTRMRLRNRNGANGAIFENAAVDLVDFGFQPSSGATALSNIRLEHRTTNMANSSNTTGEFQFVNTGSGSSIPWFSTGPSFSSFKTGKVGIGTTAPTALLDVNQTTAGSAAMQSGNAGAIFWKVLNPAGGATNTFNAANSVMYVGMDTGTSRSINAAGTINASGADFAEWIEWDGEKPQMGSVVHYRGSYVVVSSPFTAAFVGNDTKDPKHSILVAFAGQLPVLVRGVVHEGDLIVAGDDGVAIAVPKSASTLKDAYKAVGTAWASSNDAGVKRVHVAVGIGLAGGLRDVASLNARTDVIENENAQIKSENQKLKKESAELRARLDKIEKMLKVK
jgi:hypothetical protein